MNNDRMCGVKHHPFCGQCCNPYRQGTGRANKRIAKQSTKAKEKADLRTEINTYLNTER